MANSGVGTEAGFNRTTHCGWLWGGLYLTLPPPTTAVTLGSSTNQVLFHFPWDLEQTYPPSPQGRGGYSSPPTGLDTHAPPANSRFLRLVDPRPQQLKQP